MQRHTITEIVNHSRSSPLERSVKKKKIKNLERRWGEWNVGLGGALIDFTWSYPLPLFCRGIHKTFVQSTWRVSHSSVQHLREYQLIRLSLLTMTNPNQLCDVLLFVCSKMAYETNLSSKLPVADRTREVWGRSLCWWCLSSGIPLCTFLLGFADSFCFVFTSSPFYEASPLCTILCNLFPWLNWYVEVFKGALRLSLYRFFWPPWERFPTWSFP